MKELFPIFLDLTDRLCAVIGGGDVALRKARAIDEAGGNLRIVAPDIRPEITDEFAEYHDIRRKQYDPTDIDDCFLVIAATDNTILNSLIATDCRERGILVNAVDQPADCDFHTPGTIRLGGIHVAISTGGRSPALARWLRREIERGLSYRLEEGLDIIEAARRRLIDQDPKGYDKRARGFEDFFESDLWRKYLDGERDLSAEEVVEWILSSTD